MTARRRAFDICLALLLALLLAPLILTLALLALALQGRPVFYLSERMRAPEQAFQLVKFRTMAPDPADSGVSGGDKAARITRLGAVLRRSRLDELPQLWNILRGDMSFVGPRPPLRRYVEQFPDLYARVLRDRPGVTGLATLVFHRHEERILGACRTPAETEAAYTSRCVPRKARIDLIHQARRTPCADLAILARTLAAAAGRLRDRPRGRRRGRAWLRRSLRKGAPPLPYDPRWRLGWFLRLYLVDSFSCTRASRDCGGLRQTCTAPGSPKGKPEPARGHLRSRSGEQPSTGLLNVRTRRASRLPPIITTRR